MLVFTHIRNYIMLLLYQNINNSTSNHLEPPDASISFECYTSDIRINVFISNNYLWERNLAFKLNSSTLKKLIFSYFLDNQEWKDIPNHVSNHCFLFTEYPYIQKLIDPNHHPACQAMYSFESSNQCFVDNLLVSNYKFNLCIYDMYETEIKASIFLRTTN